MEGLILVLVYAIVAAIGYGMRDRTVDGTETSLCLTCVHAMVTRGTGGQERVACIYGGGLLPIDFTVCQCTCYRSGESADTIVHIEGFARETPAIYAEVRIP